MVTVTINGSPRTEVGKKATKADRNAGRVPCVLYGSGNENIHFTTTFNDVRNLVFTSDFKLAEVKVDGKSIKCIVKNVQFHPIKDNILHIDFLQLIDGQPLTVELPLAFKGTSPGVRSGGKFFQKTRTLKVKTTPESIINEIPVDISDLKLGNSLRVKDIKSIPGVEFLTPQTLPIASVNIPRGLSKEEEEAEAAAAAATTTTTTTTASEATETTNA